jgi:membrane-associated phospholipid phosphatase
VKIASAKMTELSIPNFRTGAILTAATGITLIALSYIIGKSEFFLLLNGNLGTIADKAFTYITYLGDGAIWIPIAVFILLMRRKYTILLLGSIVYSTIFAQIPKHFFFNGIPRPTKLIADWSTIHIVPGVYLNSVDSFPSGHTTTAQQCISFVLFIDTQKMDNTCGLPIHVLSRIFKNLFGAAFPSRCGCWYDWRNY